MRPKLGRAAWAGIRAPTDAVAAAGAVAEAVGGADAAERAAAGGFADAGAAKSSGAMSGNDDTVILRKCAGISFGAGVGGRGAVGGVCAARDGGGFCGGAGCARDGG